MDPSHSPRHRDPNVHPSRPILKPRDGGSRRSDGPSVQFETLPTPLPRPATADPQPSPQSRMPEHGKVPSRHAFWAEDLTTQQLRSRQASNPPTPQPARQRSLSHPAADNHRELLSPLTRPTGKAEECPEIETIMLGKWAIGVGYGPVLEPRIIASLKILPVLNPVLLAPLSEGDHIVWNMISHPSTAKRVGDGFEQPFEAFRYEPASFPRLTILNVISPSFPWIINLRSGDLNVGVTVGDVLLGIFFYLQVALKSVELDRICPQYRASIMETSIARKQLISEESFGLQLIDWMLGKTQFLGLERDTTYITERRMLSSPDLYVLCTKMPVP
ncbi:hypothetical protein EDD18DRAFT_1173645 [Armillaria luteobubalina]|uniref:DUF6699 domain-containing protein n=1 Tax=Armillaria luteobubalina TaxID=153913 RepID=A0AA39UVU3_9AGAR|nr:hypothetical protein EDD18DRAFT_1173645 [Armillaria luteobubalina]